MTYEEDGRPEAVFGFAVEVSCQGARLLVANHMRDGKVYGKQHLSHK